MSASGRRSGSSGALRASRSSGGYGDTSSSSKMATTKDTVAAAASPAMAGVTRPGIRDANTRRRPAPKVITDGAVQLSSPTSDGGPRRPLSDLAGESPSSSTAAGYSPTAQSPLAAKSSPTAGAPAPLPSSEEQALPTVVQRTGGYGTAVTLPHAPPALASESQAATSSSLAVSSSGKPEAGSPKLPDAERIMLGLMQARNGFDGTDNPHCTISTDADAAAEIRTKVFRMGAPLLRSTIPVSVGTPRGDKRDKYNKLAKAPRCPGDDDSDVETVISLSDAEVEDQGALSVTLDFPC